MLFAIFNMETPFDHSHAATGIFFYKWGEVGHGMHGLAWVCSSGLGFKGGGS